MAELIKTRLDNYNNNQFYPGKNLLVRILWYFTNILFFLNPLNPFSKFKVILLRIFGAEVGKSVVIKPAVNIKYPWKLKIGNNVWIGEKVWIDNLAQVIIGNNCCISQETILLTGNHNYKKSTFDLITGTIILEDGVWIGARAMLTLNIRCLEHSVLVAGSVLSSDMQPYSVYRGNPAIRIKERIFE